MKRPAKIALRGETIRLLTDLRPVHGGAGVKPTNTSGAGCDCWPDPLPGAVVSRHCDIGPPK